MPRRLITGQMNFDHWSNNCFRYARAGGERSRGGWGGGVGGGRETDRQRDRESDREGGGLRGGEIEGHVLLQQHTKKIDWSIVIHICKNGGM